MLLANFTFIFIFCKSALAQYVDESEVGQQQISETLNWALNLCLLNDQPDSLKWVLSQGADPTKLVVMRNGAKTYPLFLAVDLKSGTCFKILLDYGKTFLPNRTPIDLNICAPHNDNIPILYWIINMDFTANGVFMKLLLETGYSPNRNPQWDVKYPPILCAMSRHGAHVKAMLLHGASATLGPGEKIILDPTCVALLKPKGVRDRANILLAAGFDRTAVIECIASKEDVWWRTYLRYDDEKIKEVDKIVADLTRNRSLQALCRDAIGQHLMSVHPETNLFCLMPKLVVPGHEFWMKDFLLYDIDI